MTVTELAGFTTTRPRANVRRQTPFTTLAPPRRPAEVAQTPAAVAAVTAAVLRNGLARS